MIVRAKSVVYKGILKKKSAENDIGREDAAAARVPAQRLALAAWFPT
jgi:hypothetical protein